MNIASIIREENYKQKDFVNKMINKYGKGVSPIRFDITKHFTERLIVSRRELMTIHEFCAIISKVFHKKICEFIYLVITCEPDERVVIARGNKHMVLRVVETADEERLVSFLTLYENDMDERIETQHILEVD